MRLVSTARCHCSSDSSSSGTAGAPTPALLNNRSSRPNRSSIAANSASTLATSRTSVGCTTASPEINEPVSTNASARRPASTTLNPSAANPTATARPMPLPAPVTRATRTVGTVIVRSFARRHATAFTAQSCRERVIGYSRPSMRIAVDGEPIEYADGDSVAVAIVRAGQHPQHGGTLCLAGDCGNCSAEIDGVAFTRTCLTPARPGLRVTRHPAVGAPALRLQPPVDPVASPNFATTTLRRLHADLVVIGAGESGAAAAAAARADDREVTVLAGELGHDVVGVYPGPVVIVRLANGQMLHVHAHDVVIATGAAELHPVCEGNMLRGIYTAAAAEQLRSRRSRPWRCRDRRPRSVASHRRRRRSCHRRAHRGRTTIPCDSLVVNSRNRAPRDLLARMVGDPHVRAAGPAATAFDLPPAPTAGTVCPCSKVTVDDLQMVWAKGSSTSSWSSVPRCAAPERARAAPACPTCVHSSPPIGATRRRRSPVVRHRAS